MQNPASVPSLIESGLRAHKQGDLRSAVSAYRTVLSISPDDPNAMQLLGVALMQMEEPAEAVGYLERAARKLRNSADVIGNLAQAYFALQRHDEARDAFRKASRLDPRNLHYQMGVATSLALQGKHAEAEPLLRRMSERHPSEPSVWFNLGNCLRDQGRGEAALEHYRRAVELAPDFIDARNNRAGVLHGLRRFSEAEHEYRECLKTAPSHLHAQLNLVSLLIDVGRFAESEPICRAVVANHPTLTVAHAFLGASLGQQGRLIEALQWHRAALAASPQDGKLVQTYAGSLVDAGRFDESLGWFARAFALNSDSGPAHRMFYGALLAHGFLAEGWREHLHRVARERFVEKFADLGLVTRLPEVLADKRICLIREQGLGDELFYLRSGSRLPASGARVLYRASNKLSSILSRVPWIAELVEETTPPPAVDLVLMVGDLPYALSTMPMSAVVAPHDAAAETRESVAAIRVRRQICVYWPEIPPPLSLIPLGTHVAAIEKRLAETGPPPYLGLTWRGGTAPAEQETAEWILHKQIDPAALVAAVGNFPGTILSLQRKPQPSELAALESALGKPLHDFSDFNDDLESMLALLSLIDDYVGVSNTNMHLRAGTGKTARVLVPCPAEWRWMARGRESPWFPGFTIYRQGYQGDWTKALDELRNDLALAFPIAS